MADIIQFDLPNALMAHDQLAQRQQQFQDAQAERNALSQAVPMLQSDPQNAFATAAKASPNAALKLLPYIKQMDDEKKAQAADRADALSKLFYTLKAQYKDPIIRKAVAQSQAASLAAHGVTPDQLANADYSDNGLDLGISNVMSVKDMIAQSNVDRTYIAGREDHKDVLANEEANRKVTIRGQNIQAAKDAEGGWAVAFDPSNNNMPFRYNTKNAQATDMQGKPYTPGGYAKPGTNNPRSAATMFIQKYMQEHPDATSEDISKQAAAFRMGQSEGGIIGSRSGAADVASQEVDVFAKQALDASHNLPRTDVAALNSALQSWDTKVKNPQLRRLMVAVDALVNARARAISPNGIPHVQDQMEGRRLLSAAFSNGDFDATVDQFQMEAAGVRSSTQASKDAFTGKKPPPASAPANIPPPPPGFVVH